MVRIEEQVGHSECEGSEDIDPKLRDIIRSLARLAAETEHRKRASKSQVERMTEQANSTSQLL